MYKKSSEILREIADTIENNPKSSPLICNHLAYNYTNEPKSYLIRSKIMRSLLPAGTVSRWLVEEKGINHQYDDQKLREYRARWCRWMAEGYEKIGD